MWWIQSNVFHIKKIWCITYQRQIHFKKINEINYKSTQPNPSQPAIQLEYSHWQLQMGNVGGKVQSRHKYVGNGPCKMPKL